MKGEEDEGWVIGRSSDRRCRAKGLGRQGGCGACGSRSASAALRALLARFLRVRRPGRAVRACGSMDAFGPMDGLPVPARTRPGFLPPSCARSPARVVDSLGGHAVAQANSRARQGASPGLPTSSNLLPLRWTRPTCGVNPSRGEAGRRHDTRPTGDDRQGSGGVRRASAAGGGACPNGHRSCPSGQCGTGGRPGGVAVRRAGPGLVRSSGARPGEGLRVRSRASSETSGARAKSPWRQGSRAAAGVARADGVRRPVCGVRCLVAGARGGGSGARARAVSGVRATGRGPRAGRRWVRCRSARRRRSPGPPGPSRPAAAAGRPRTGCRARARR